jgi:RNA 2',3'-cyclic 3'-phosphodiesterase
MTNDRPRKVRTFLAVEVAAPIHAALVDLKHELERCDAGVRWVRDEALHATVKFLGGVEESALPALRAAVADAIGGAVAPTAAVRGLGAFPNLKRPRVLWVGIECQPLTAIAAAIDRALEPLGFAPEARAFRAHVTLGRVNSMRNWSALEAPLQKHWRDDFGTCTLAGLIGFRSDLRRDGAVYTKLWTIPFGA